MQSFEQVTGTVAPLDRANVDTDQIIPKQFLKSIRRTGFGDNLFDAWRYLDEGDIGMNPNERQINHEFVLNDARYQDAQVLLARDNFGCGSSREHAVWALLEYGFRAVLAPSFADIFFNNCFKNGLLPVVLPAEEIEQLFELANGPQPLELTVDLHSNEVRQVNGRTLGFSLDSHRREKMLQGLDDISLSLVHTDEITAFEAQHRQRQPWNFGQH